MTVSQKQTGSKTERSSETAAERVPSFRDALNAPNLITISRLFLAVAMFVLIYIDGFWITAAILFTVAAATDFLDGYIARRYGLITVIGRIMDPFADKIIICGAFIFLLDKKIDGGYGSGVNAWMVLIVIGREMFITSLRGFLEQQGIDFSASWSGKIKMGLQCMAVTGSLLSLTPQFRDIEAFIHVRDVLLWGAVIFTAYSGLAYVTRAMALIRSQPQDGSR